MVLITGYYLMCLLLVEPRKGR